MHAACAKLRGVKALCIPAGHRVLQAEGGRPQGGQLAGRRRRTNTEGPVSGCPAELLGSSSGA